ncbi:hypothetical protein PV10_03850 [Exophiala mesophila]|uniref:Uncharacterized protein n=1 Tax=Exophiala mesophila TaxID=212818 RepID=A0A0D1ZFD5_EXOME|nr:uncharacterized protein PV10_03850 [Exophiala mesophila]KIV92564.1 hypothetical protein PV10_03850 [Exophiala mesophila]
MYSSSRSQDDLTPPAPPPSPCHENFRRQPRNDYFAGIAIQLVFNGKRAKKFTVDPPEGGQELSDSDGSSIGASSIFSDHSSNDDNSSIGTEACKEDSADIKRINFRGVIPGGEVPSGDEHSWQPPPMIQRVAEELVDASYILVRLSIDLDDAILRTILQVPSITPLNDGSREILVQNAYLPTLQTRLHEMHIQFTLDLEYNPLTPLQEDVEYWGLENARELYALWLWKGPLGLSGKPGLLQKCTTVNS